jgi:hypothetical protein
MEELLDELFVRNQLWEAHAQAEEWRPLIRLRLRHEHTFATINIEAGSVDGLRSVLCRLGFLAPRKSVHVVSG